MAKKFNILNLSYSAAILGAACMLVLSILGLFGIYSNTVTAMQQWHLFYDLSALGIFTGMIEAAIASFIMVYSFGWIYEKIESR